MVISSDEAIVKAREFASNWLMGENIADLFPRCGGFTLLAIIKILR